MTILALATAPLIAGTGAAYADSPVNISRDGGAFKGAVGWYHYPTNHGAMRLYGTLTDNKCDGHSVYLQATVEGYGWRELLRLRGGCGTSGRTDTALYDPQMTDTQNGRVRVCIDLSALPDPCTEYRVSRYGNP